VKKIMKKILAMGASVAMLLATSTPVFAATTTIMNNDVVVDANSGKSTQTGGWTQTMQAGTAFTDGYQNISSVAPAWINTTNIMNNNVVASANSGAGTQTGGWKQWMYAGSAATQGLQNISSVAPAWINPTNIIDNNVVVSANSGAGTQTGGGWFSTQTMVTDFAQAKGAQWIVSNVH
jgi:hypothetical protein